MPEADKEGERYSAEIPQTSPGFFLKGSHQLDWGMKNCLARTFNPDSGRTVMLAIDHGYFQGPTTGLERIDLSILPLLPSCDALFCTRGILRSVVPAQSQKPMVLRASGGPSILREELSDEQIAMDMDDAVRLNAAGVGIQVFIGGEHETRSVHNMTRLVDAGIRAGIPVMGITAVGLSTRATSPRCLGVLKTTICPRFGASNLYASRLAITRSLNRPWQKAIGFAQWSVGSIDGVGMRYGFATCA